MHFAWPPRRSESEDASFVAKSATPSDGFASLLQTAAAGLHAVTQQILEQFHVHEDQSMWLWATVGMAKSAGSVSSGSGEISRVRTRLKMHGFAGGFAPS